MPSKDFLIKDLVIKGQEPLYQTKPEDRIYAESSKRTAASTVTATHTGQPQCKRYTTSAPLDLTTVSLLKETLQDTGMGRNSLWEVL